MVIACITFSITQKEITKQARLDIIVEIGFYAEHTIIDISLIYRIASKR